MVDKEEDDAVDGVIETLIFDLPLLVSVLLREFVFILMLLLLVLFRLLLVLVLVLVLLLLLRPLL